MTWPDTLHPNTSALDKAHAQAIYELNCLVDVIQIFDPFQRESDPKTKLGTTARRLR